MAALPIEIEHKRISTSSQTTHGENDKFLYAGPINLTYADVKDKFKAHLKSFKLNFEKLNIKEYKAPNKVQVRENLSKLKRQSASPKTKKNWVNEIFENLPTLNQRYKPRRFQLENKSQAQKIPLRVKKRNLSAGVEDELFNELLPKLHQKKKSDFAMHKTFYDILDDLNAKVVKKKDSLFTN